MKGRSLAIILVAMVASSNAAASIVTVDARTDRVTATCSDDSQGIASLVFELHTGQAVTSWSAGIYAIEATRTSSCDFIIEMTSAGPLDVGVYGPIDLVQCNGPMLLPGNMGRAQEMATVYDLNGDIQPAEFVFLGDIFIPEPATLSTMALGAVAMLRRRR